MPLRTVGNVLLKAPRVSSIAARGIASSSRRHAITKFAMPAMSPTMTEGGIASWKLKEGDSFGAGDVILEIETDKATMDVEAQEEGILGKILVQNGAKEVQVGKTIALLAEEGDDISNLEAPKEEEESSSAAEPAPAKVESSAAPASPNPAPPSTAQKTQSQPTPQVAAAPAAHTDSHGAMFPSVQRILAENNVPAEEVARIKGSGIRGMITKGDVLTFLGKADGPTGTYQAPRGGVAELGGPPSQGAEKSPRTGPRGDGAASQASREPATEQAMRSWIIGGLAQQAYKSRNGPPATPLDAKTGLDQLLASYRS